MTGRVAMLAAGMLAVCAVLTGCQGTPGGAAPNTAPIAADPTPTPSASPSAATPAGFVGVLGRSFVVDGSPFRFVGANIYDAAASDRYSCRPGSRMSDEQLTTTLRDLHDRAGATVLRFWAYQPYTQGGTYWGGIDRVLTAARATGMKVIPVLEDGPGDCTTTARPVPKTQYDGDTWYSEGYRVPYGNATLSYRDYVAEVVAHYADDPTILGWSMMNEADTAARTELTQPVLVDFATDMAGVIRAADPNHLITVGTQSNGAPGASGADFSQVYGVQGISFAEVHDWGYWGSDTEPMPGGTGTEPPAPASMRCRPANAPIACSFALARSLDKPLVVGESGMQGTTPTERTDRAARMRAKMDAAFAAGASGYLVWSVTTGRTDGYDVSAAGSDPLLEQMRQVAGGLR